MGVQGEFPDELWFGMASNGLYAERLEPGQDPRGALCDAVLTNTDDPRRLSELAATGVPVIVATNARADELAELLRLGVNEVLALPLEADVVARKIRRAVERSRRRMRRRR